MLFFNAVSIKHDEDGPPPAKVEEMNGRKVYARARAGAATAHRNKPWPQG
jgi:hypothetical protein